MIVRELYSRVLLDPCLENNNELCIVSGYASATFSRKHLDDLSAKVGKDNAPKVNLIIGMPSKRADHPHYLNLEKEFADRFKVYYIEDKPPVHSKVYAWKGGKSIGFAGSANYSQFGFSHEKQINQLTQTDPAQIFSFYNSLLPRATPVSEFNYKQIEYRELQTVGGSVGPGLIEWLIPHVAVRISFLSSDGKLPAKSGLNWGQRGGRERNQAYLSLRSDSRTEGFLPEVGFTFSLITDDNNAFDCVVAQEGRKAIHSTKNNSFIGSYIRKRIGLKSGEFVTREHLEKYGRTDFTLIKINDETFKFDLSI